MQSRFKMLPCNSQMLYQAGSALHMLRSGQLHEVELSSTRHDCKLACTTGALRVRLGHQACRMYLSEKACMVDSMPYEVS